MSHIKFKLLFPKPPKILNVNYYDCILKNEKKVNESLKFNFNNFYRKPRLKPLIPIFDKNFNQINNDEKVIYYYNSKNNLFINKNKKFSLLKHHKKSFSSNEINHNLTENNKNFTDFNNNNNNNNKIGKEIKNIKLIFNKKINNNFSIYSNNNLPFIKKKKLYSKNNIKKNYLYKNLNNKREFSV